ncbi:MAG TPA: SPOR domain-containing protein [Steroidobacteraceae bacterium]|nr:SPOR domain-containing protein [Steroidobacteraceae bacterium]
MSDSHDSPGGSAGDRARFSRSNDPRALYVINLFSSLVPMPLEVPDARGLEGLAVFRSRRVEDGRERYRLHLGYFDRREDAEAALSVVQKHFPGAWVASAPRSGLGSLDDTNLSEFRLLRTPTPLAAEIDARLNVTEAHNAQRYVIQLSWTSQRVDPDDLPQLAIFKAYALYTVTLMRAGVRYYGIRLGFFSSVISARQVALYVRPDFPSVAVVPISDREHTRAREMIRQREIRAAPPAETVAPVTTPELEVSQEPPSSEAPPALELISEPAQAEEPEPLLEPSPAAPDEESSTSAPRPFTEVYVAEATERIAGQPQASAFTREELIEALRNSNLSGDDAASRSALTRLLHRLTDRLG